MKPATPKIQLLLEIGNPGRSCNWLPYVERYGFDSSDVTSLIDLVCNSDYDNLSDNDPAVWAPLHAWRTLGQLKAETAVEPLISCFDRLYEDDWALSELGEVIAMIGPSAIDLIAAYWRLPDKEEFAYVMAVDALADIAKAHPHYRGDVIEAYRTYMHEPYIQHDALNGLLIGRLMDLNAVELIEEIRHLFSLDCVDISCAGDLEDVEIGMGLRQRRTTPRPSLYPDLKVLRQLAAQPVDTYVRAVKTGRNDPCPCGSGRKYKKCCAA